MASPARAAQQRRKNNGQNIRAAQFGNGDATVRYRHWEFPKAPE